MQHVLCYNLQTNFASWHRVQNGTHLHRWALLSHLITDAPFHVVKLLQFVAYFPSENSKWLRLKQKSPSWHWVVNGVRLDECGNGGNLTHKKACFIFIGWIQAWYDFTLDIKSDNTNLQITKGMLNSFSFDIISHHKSCWLHKFTVLFLLQTKQILIFIQNKWFWMYSNSCSNLNSFF